MVYIIAVLLLLLSGFVSLELTKQRVQLETENKLLNITNKQSPFVWNFVEFKGDIVGSFQHFWREINSIGQIIALKGSNPQLSLNFSGDVINSNAHNELIIKSQSVKPFKLKIQFKSNIDDDVFWYSNVIPISNSQQIINLDRLWLGVADDGSKPQKGTWGDEKHKVSSIVLHFINSQSDLIIDEISLPFTGDNLDVTYYEINCNGNVLSEVDTRGINIFKLQEDCWFSSNYMWLKRIVQNKYPESLLKINSLSLKLDATGHKVNQVYTNIYKLNSLLFLLLLIVLIVALVIRKKHTHAVIQEQSWYKWLGKQLLFKGVSKVVSPYHVAINYAVVLIPTTLIIIILLIFKSPTSLDFQVLPLYFLWALFQQCILGYVLAQRVFYNHTNNRLVSSILAGLVFSTLHMPSTTLMLVTFIAGCFWAYSWLIFKRLLPLALSHAVLALIFYHVITDKYNYSAKVFHLFWE